MPNHTLFVKHAILDAMQSFFAESGVEGMRYDQDINQTEILIMDDLVDKELDLGYRPRIILHCGSLQTYDASMGNIIMFDPMSSKQMVGKMLVGRSVITCESRSGVQAGGMASLLYSMMIANYDQFLRRGFKWFKPVSISSERIIDADAEIRRSAYDVAVEHTHSIIMEVENVGDTIEAISVSADIAIGTELSFGEIGNPYEDGYASQGAIVEPTYPLKFKK